MPPDTPPLRDQLAASEANLRESQELFAKSFHSSPVLMTIAALPGGEFIEVNEAFLQGVALPRDQVIGRTTLDLNLWRDVDQRQRFIEQISQNISIRDFEAQFNSGSGEPRFYIVNADRIELKGKPCILTVAMDVNDRQRRLRAEAALAYVERRYRNLFENAAEGLYLSSPDGKFLEVNPALAQMLGYTNAIECIDSINAIDRQVYMKPGRRADFFELLRDRDHVTDFESEVRRRDGTTFWVSESVRAVRDKKGEVSHLEGVAVDITARREAAMALAEAKDAADQANRAKSQFLASMSHELRTPLNGILGFTQVLRRDAQLTSEHQHGLNVIHESAEHLLSLINDVLDLSKVEAGRLELHPTSFDLASLLAGVSELLSPQARAKGIAFNALISSALPTRVTADSARLRQVLINLVANAVKFTGEGSVTLEATCPPDTARDDGHTLVRFGVRDTGAGIPQDQFPKLFQPFEQIGDSAHHQDGTGLGLAISQRLVTAMGGDLNVESANETGSYFWFELALPTAAETTTPFAETSSIIGFEGPAPKVLVADDLPANADVLRSLLEPIGFQIDIAETGEAALAQARANRPDLVLMDLRMPGMGGLAAIQALRQDETTRDIRIIAVTASAYDFDRTQALAEGCDDFIPKPVRAETLLESIGRVLDLKWRHTTTAQPTPPPFSNAASRAPAGQVEAFYQLALAGDVVALREQAERLQETQPQYHQFAEDVLELTRNFKLKALRKLLSPLRTDSSDHD